MSLALGKNSVNAKQPLHLDSTNHLLVNDSTNKAVLDQIATNTANINVNVGDVEINVGDLETLQTTTNTTLASILVDTDAIDSSCNTIEAQSVLTASRLNNIQNKISANTDGTGDTLGQIASNILTKNTAAEVHLGNVETKLGTIETDIETTNSLLSTIDGVLDVNVGQLTAIDNVLDNSLVKLTEIDTAIDTIDTVLDASLVKQTNIETLLTAGNVDHAANEVLLTALVNDLAGIEIINAASEAHLGNIDTGVDVLEACVGSNKVNVNISSGNITGFATSALQGDIESSLNSLISANHTDLVAFESSLTSMESKQDTMIGHNDGVETLLTAIDGRVDGIEGLQGTANTHLSEIEGAVETLEACVGSSKVNVNISSGNISGFATQTTLAACATDLAALEVLQTATNSKIDTIKVDTEAIETAVEILSANQSKTVTQLLYGTGNLVANGTPESSSNSVEMLNNGERVTTFIEAQNVSWDAFNEWSYDNSTWFQDTSLNFSGNQNIQYHDFKKGKYLRVKVNNTQGTSGDTNAFVVNIVQ